MKIAFISTNIGSTKDGIGMYTYNLIKELKENNQIEIFEITAKTEDLKGMKKLISIEMLKKIIDFIKHYKHLKIEKINFIIEYPFFEWSPFSIIGILFLRLYFNKSNIILSIHEYERVNLMRRIATDILIRISNRCMVTDFKLYEKLNKRKKTVLRDIPSNIAKVDSEKKVKKDGNSYCYFGLINKSKAFDEMIGAWEKFNLEKKNSLNIYTSSEIEVINAENYNISIYRNLANEELSLELQKNKFMILPIKPSIGENNGTLKAAAIHGCIPIGIFSEELSGLGLRIEGAEYSVEALYKVLNETKKLQGQKERIERLEKYSENFSFNKIAKKVMEIIEN